MTANARRPRESIFGRASSGLYAIVIKSSSMGTPRVFLDSWWDIRATPRVLSCWAVLEPITGLYQPHRSEGADNTCGASSGKAEWHGSASEFLHGLCIPVSSKHCGTGRLATRQPAPCFSSRPVQVKPHIGHIRHTDLDDLVLLSRVWIAFFSASPSRSSMLALPGVRDIVQAKPQSVNIKHQYPDPFPVRTDFRNLRGHRTKASMKAYLLGF